MTGLSARALRGVIDTIVFDKNKQATEQLYTRVFGRDGPWIKHLVEADFTQFTDEDFWESFNSAMERTNGWLKQSMNFDALLFDGLHALDKAVVVATFIQYSFRNWETLLRVAVERAEEEGDLDSMVAWDNRLLGVFDDGERGMRVFDLGDWDNGLAEFKRAVEFLTDDTHA